MQLQRWAIILSGGQGTDRHGSTTRGHQQRGLPWFDAAVHLVHRRLQGALNEGLQKGATLGRNRVIFDKITLEPHRADTGTGECTGIPTIGQDQLGGSAADVKHQMRTITERHSRQDAEVNQARFLGATDEIHVQAKLIIDRLEKVPAVGSLTHSTGGGDDDLLHLVTECELLKVTQALQATGDRLRRELTSLWIALTQTSGGFFRQINAERSQGHIHRRHEHVGGVRADINRGHAPNLPQLALTGVLSLVRTLIIAVHGGHRRRLGT